MKIDLKQAVKLFYSQSSFDQIYHEAVANAFDADAKNIRICFEADSLSDVSTFKLTISDDGVGFTNDRYEKFCKLMNVEEEDIKHRGLGRLVYLFYFDKVKVDTYFEKSKHRRFYFDESLGDDSIESITYDVEEHPSGSTLFFEGYNLKKLAMKDFSDPQWIKTKLLKKFIVQFLKLKQKRESFRITIENRIGKHNSIKEITPDSIPNFVEKKFTPSYLLDGEMKMFYSVENSKNTSIITAMAIDDRSEPVDIFAEGNEPQGYEMFFILYSDSFQGQTDAIRNKINIPKNELDPIKKEFRKQIIEILKNKVPNAIQHQQNEEKKLKIEFPHLDGYFDENVIGICSQADVVREAQKKFMNEERRLLFKTSLNDDDYDKSLELAGRSLTQYITFRQYIINKLKDVDISDKEEIIHNLIVPKRQKIQAPNSYTNIYRNNIWIFDDKFMTFDVVLSEQETTELLKQIDEKTTIKDINRPDIAIIFSNDPSVSPKVDVVIIELKKKGLKGGENLKVEYQLEQRARALYSLYKDKIQSVWLYGVTQLDDDYQSTLNTIGYQPLYSKGTVYVNTNPITISMNPEKITIPAVRYVMDIDAVIKDSDARNKAFMDLIKEKMQMNS